MEKRKLKGFTLIELIIVMAVFSLLMLGAMSLVGPVSKIHKHTNDFEKSYAYVDTIQNYIQNTVEYADNVWVYQGDVESQLGTITLDFMKSYYKDIVVNNAVSSSNIKNANCTVRVMTILNKDTTINGTDYTKGQILMRDVTYASNATAAQTLSNAEPQINPMFFSDRYAFDYILGVSRFVENGDLVSVENMDSANYPNPVDDSGNPIYSSYIDYAKGIIEKPKDLAIAVVTYDTKQNSDGTYNFTEHYADVSDPTSRCWKDYSKTSLYSAVNIPLVNIVERNNSVNESYFTRGTLADGSQGIISASPAASSPYLVKDITMSTNDNIYIIYTLCDEAAVYPGGTTTAPAAPAVTTTTTAAP